MSRSKLRRASRNLLAAQQDGICPWCKLSLPEDLTGIELDHIIPRSRGGPDDLWNRQVLHRHCNWGRGSKGNELTPEAEALAALHGVVLHEPLPTAWPGSTKAGTGGKLNPGYGPARDPRLPSGS